MKHKQIKVQAYSRKKAYIDAKRLADAFSISRNRLAKELGIHFTTIYLWEKSGLSVLGRLLLLAKDAGLLDEILTDKKPKR